MTHILDFVRASPDYAHGKSDADHDFRAGRLAQLVFGPPPPWWNDVVSDLRRRYEITFETVETPNGASIARCIGYNERMREHITARFGQDVVGIAESAAENI